MEVQSGALLRRSSAGPSRNYNDISRWKLRANSLFPVPATWQTQFSLLSAYAKAMGGCQGRFRPWTLWQSWESWRPEPRSRLDLNPLRWYIQARTESPGMEAINHEEYPGTHRRRRRSLRGTGLVPRLVQN